MAEASWLADPTGTHELRYWNGSSWTEHVSDQGTTGQDPLTTEPPPPADAYPPQPTPPPAATTPAAAPAAGGRPSWKDRLKQVADQGRAIADQGKQKLAEQSAKRTQQWANDPNTVWFGESKNAATSVAGVSRARYRITKDRVWIERGLLGTRTESVPLWSIKDMDVRQAVRRRGEDIGDVVLNLEDPADGTSQDTSTTSGNIEGTTSGQVVLDNIESPYAVLDILAPLISEARSRKTVERQSQYPHVNPDMAGSAFGSPTMPAPAPAAPPPPAEPQPDLADQLRRLAGLRDEGILTEDEFAAQKAKLLGG
jgi:hypothetical protein